MTTFNTDYNNTELLDQELTTAELSEDQLKGVAGGIPGVSLFGAFLKGAFHNGIPWL
ncbi:MULTISPECIES: hypothetical protein [unclassified Prochlorococcus]|uniref:hypothetical protein n=1 Tax=unclassified Prochlorococcus TaxID=2627481 RepID=UPI0005337C57|nr:hypothetical protein [Prochlorococcus sp. MIT 0702]KGG25265.1 hypothetical protein EV13_3090 [Prochlorococcus sp. MIT 0702]